jgi:RHS repeat-associated protein
VTYAYHVAATSSSPDIGQLKSVTSSAASTQYVYNELGTVAASANTIDGYPGYHIFGYDYYLSGNLKRMQYPSGKLVNYDVDDAGRTNKAYTASTTYADMTVSGATNPFTADGRIVQMKLGNNRWETHDYQTPGTPTVYKFGTTQGLGDITQLSYNFDGANNNGNVIGQTITRGTGNTWNQTYTYDGVNRLSTVNESAGQTWSQTYGYDQYGNRYISASPNITTELHEPTLPTQFNTANNRLTMTGVTYDAAGNQTTYDPYSLEYDAENRNTIVKISGNPYVTYSYDGDGRRVKKQVTNGATTYYVYDAMGQMAVEYSTQAPAPGTTGTSYMFTDMLGSVRTITDQTGAVVENYDYLPFGRMLSSGVNNRSAAGFYPPDPDTNLSSRTPQKFTGKERDAETGLDFFLARYYSAAQGRFMSSDPIIVTPERFRDPQQFNAYSYVRNNPMKLIDPTGEILTLSGDVDESMAQICKMIGVDSGCDQRISYDEVNNTITVDTTGLDNSGADLLNDVTGSAFHYDLYMGFQGAESRKENAVPTLAGSQPFRNLMENLDWGSDDRLGNGKQVRDYPKPFIDDQIAIDPSCQGEVLLIKRQQRLTA